jgi:hypothetical protein
MTIDFSKSAPNKTLQGSAVLVLTIYISTMMLMVAATTQSAVWLRKELNLVERRQIERWQRLSGESTQPPAKPKLPPVAP